MRPHARCARGDNCPLGSLSSPLHECGDDLSINVSCRVESYYRAMTNNVRTLSGLSQSTAGQFRSSKIETGKQTDRSVSHRR